MGRIFEKPWFWIAAIGLAFGLPLSQSLKRPQLKPPPVLGRMQDFALVDQDGQPFESKNRLGGIVSLFSFVSADCGEPCRESIEHLYRLKKSLKGAGPTVRVLSLTSTQVPDKPERLKQLGQSLNASFRAWTFLTGEPEAVRSLRDQLLTYAPEGFRNPSDPQLLAKAGVLVLVDQIGQIRSIREILKPDALTETVKDTAVLINTRPPTN